MEMRGFSFDYLLVFSAILEVDYPRGFIELRYRLLCCVFYFCFFCGEELILLGGSLCGKFNCGFCLYGYLQ